METKNVAPKQIISGTLTTTMNKIQNDCNPVIERMMAEAESKNLPAVGPLEFIYTGASEDRDKAFHLEIALPVQANPGTTLTGFEIKETPDFKCAAHTYKGKMENIDSAYHEVFGKIEENALKPNDVIREVYENWVSFSSEENIVEIQIGIN